MNSLTGPLIEVMEKKLEIMKADSWESLTSFQKEEIQKGIDEANNGEVADYNDFMKEHRK